MSRCEDCVHDGCCDGLPHCSGGAFVSRWVECSRCGRTVDQEDGIDDDDGNFLCGDCAAQDMAEREPE